MHGHRDEFIARLCTERSTAYQQRLQAFNEKLAAEREKRLAERRKQRIEKRRQEVGTFSPLDHHLQLRILKFIRTYLK